MSGNSTSEKSTNIRSKIGPLIALIITAAVIIWMLIGGNGITTALAEDKDSASETTQPNIPTKASVKQVQAATITAAPMTTQMTLSGTTRASETLALQSSYSGTLTKVNFNKGDIVKKGQAIVSVDTRVLRAEIAKADAIREEKKLDLAAVERLVNKKLSSKVSLAAAKSALAEAEANRQGLLIDIEHAETRAPFSGVINDIHVNTGQVINAGDKIADLVSLQPLTIYAQVPQKNIGQIKPNMSVSVNTLGDNTVPGTVSFINRIADTGTRSIGIEVDIPNENNAIPAGISATMTLQFVAQAAHSFSPALLTLNNEGKTSVKTLNENNVVIISPIKILRAGRDKVWVAGLPDTVNIITVGQGFVNAGDTVAPQFSNNTQNQ